MPHTHTPFCSCTAPASPCCPPQVWPSDIQPRTCVIARRAEPGAAGKLHGVSSDPDSLCLAVADLLHADQSELSWRAASALESNIVDVSTFMELRVRQAQLGGLGRWGGGGVGGGGGWHELTRAAAACGLGESQA